MENKSPYFTMSVGFTLEDRDTLSNTISKTDIIVSDIEVFNNRVGRGSIVKVIINSARYVFIKKATEIMISIPDPRGVVIYCMSVDGEISDRISYSDVKLGFRKLDIDFLSSIGTSQELFIYKTDML